MLTLKRASKFRPGGPWDHDDYDMFDGDRHIGRILWTYAEALVKDPRARPRSGLNCACIFLLDCSHVTTGKTSKSM